MALAEPVEEQPTDQPPWVRQRADVNSGGSSPGRQVHLQGYRFIKVLGVVAKACPEAGRRDGDVEYWATNELTMTPEQREVLAKQAWGIEVYHRGIKQYCGVKKYPARKATARRFHILLALQAFLRLEVHRLRTGVSWYQAKAAIIQSAIREYLAHPSYLLDSAA